jgi:hypothetical protein
MAIAADELPEFRPIPNSDPQSLLDEFDDDD